jgi:hypothetical protein
VVVISPRVKTSLERLYAAVDAPKDKILELEVKKMSRNDVEQEIFDLTNELSANIEEIKRRAFNDGVRAALQKNAVLSGTDASAPAQAQSFQSVQPFQSAQQPAPQTNVFIESPAAVSSAAPSNAVKKVAPREAVQSTDEVAAKLSLLNDKLDEVDGALASIHEMQLDLQKTQDEVRREFASKLGEFVALNCEAREYVDSVRSVASRMTDVGAKLGDALEENARVAASARDAPFSLDVVTDKLDELERKVDSIGEKGASKEMQEENSRLLSSQGIELSSLKNALKKQLKSVRHASKRITRVSRELEDVEGAVKRSGRKTNRSVRRVAEEFGVKTKANARKIAATAKKVGGANSKTKAAAKAKASVRSKPKHARRTVKHSAKLAVKRVSKKAVKKAVVTTRKAGENVNVTINTA